MGACLIALAVAMLVFDRRDWLGVPYPFLLLFFVVVGVGATVELLALLDAQLRPPRAVCVVAVLAVLSANWVYPLGFRVLGAPLEVVTNVFAATALGMFLVEMARFREPGGSVVRIAVGVWVTAYLGLLPSFLAQLRWLGGPDDSSADRGLVAVALAILVPKVCDIGAYFTGRALGKRPMAPVLSPKKTWEGFAGGMFAAAFVSVVVNRRYAVLPDDWIAIGFGLTVGLAGIFGDLAESLVKRDCKKKDAGAAVPGFGGVLDVIDSILFAAPVAYWWLRC